ncbi:hypothetical protein HU200_061731 [Digitaria exilis]|uniref:Uncharacterized protein n=1 Tax=Digitaria exilis TaxID=1010633 RepID=A0A835AH45_9POAL|nr:hypothetical protein HU200_061731 [Digitaria exilis]
MAFRKVIFATAVLAIALSSQSVASKTKNAAIPPSPTHHPPSPVYYVDIADLLDVAGPFQTFLNYLQTTNVIEIFQRQANTTKIGITIFVPRDSAFAALKKKNTLAGLITKGQLKSLLLFHAFRKFYSLAELGKLSRRNPVATFAGSKYTLNLTDDNGSIRVKSTWSNAKIVSCVYARAPVAVYEVDKSHDEHVPVITEKKLIKMSVEILDGSTVRSFVEDEFAFNSTVDGRFAALDANHDGLLSYSEMARELMSLRVLEKHFGVDEESVKPNELAGLYRGLFARFDRDGSGEVDRDEFRAEMKEVMLAVANGLGFLPVQMVVEEGSFLKIAVDRELGQLAKAA